MESRLPCSKLDSTSKKNSAKCLATSLRIELLKARMCARSNGCVYAMKFRCSASPRARVHVRVNRVDHVQESLLRDPVRRRVGHQLARKEWSMRVHSIGLLLIDNLCTCRLSCFAASVTVTKAQMVRVCLSPPKPKYNERFATCASGAGIHGDVLNGHTGTGGSSLVLLTKICPRMVITCFRGSPKNPLDLTRFQVRE